MDGLGAVVSVGYGFDNEGGAAHAVTSSEDTGATGGKGIGVDSNSALRRQTYAGVVRDESQTSSLAYREDHHVGGQHVLRALLRFHREPSVIIELEAGHAPALHTGHVPIAVVHNAQKSKVIMNRDAFFCRCLDFRVVRRHIAVVFKAGHMDFTCAQPHRSTGHINGHVAATQHQNASVLNVGEADVDGWRLPI